MLTILSGERIRDLLHSVVGLHEVGDHGEQRPWYASFMSNVASTVERVRGKRTACTVRSLSPSLRTARVRRCAQPREEGSLWHFIRPDQSDIGV